MRGWHTVWKCNVSSKCIFTHHKTQQRKMFKRKATRSHDIQCLSNCFYRKRMSAWKEVTCTYLQNTKPDMHSPHSLPLCYLFNGRQHTGHTGPMRLQQNTSTCLPWDNKSQSQMGILAEASQPSSAADTQAPMAGFTEAQITPSNLQAADNLISLDNLHDEGLLSNITKPGINLLTFFAVSFNMLWISQSSTRLHLRTSYLYFLE